MRNPSRKVVETYLRHNQMHAKLECGHVVIARARWVEGTGPVYNKTSQCWTCGMQGRGE